MLKSVKKDFLPKTTKDVRTNMIALFVSQEQNVTNLRADKEPNVRDKRNWKQWLWIYSFIQVGGGGGGGRGKLMWAVVNKKLMHSMFYMLKFPR